MRQLVFALGLLTACGGIEADDDACPAGTHDEDGACVADVACMPNTCNGHGACTVAGAETLCACDTGYLGDSCADCAPGFEDAGGSCQQIACGGLECGAFGTCSDATGTPTCECRFGMTGPACDQCTPPAQNLVWDTFGGAGEHHTITIAPGDIVVAELPALPVTSNGPQIVGSATFGEVPFVPDGRYTLSFSRCPGDLTAFSDSQITPDGVSPCRGEFLFRTGRLDWRETGGPNMFQCYVPSADGPWYANLYVDADDVAACQAEVGRPCVINWQWN